jgi:UDP-N-acetylmuramyl tripeptide synthase
MAKRHITLLGKVIRQAARFRGGGSALPGLVVEKLDKNFLAHTLNQLPHGVVVISGTNGKTTTAKMVAELLEGQGLKVFTNRSGSNFIRGVISALLEAINLNGTLDADIAVLELDEAHAVHFVKEVTPRYSLLLNIMRDQLDRFGEIDTTTKLLTTIAKHTSQAVVLNQEDTRIRNIAKSLPASVDVHYFGLSPNLRQQFPNDDELYGQKNPLSINNKQENSVILESINKHKATFIYSGQPVETSLKLSGIYNIFNAAAALSLVSAICGSKCDEKKLFSSLANVTPAFGRGEQFIVNNKPLELVLVKNPAGFRLSLQSFNPANTTTMIAINDNYADGRDMSWLWDVGFDSLRKHSISVTGTRAYDMALRLQYDEVKIASVDTNIKSALNKFLKTETHKPKRIFCTYTAMLSLRRELKNFTKVENAL